MKEDKFEKVVKRDNYLLGGICLNSFVFIFLVVISIISKGEYWVGLALGGIGIQLAYMITFYFKKRKVYWRKIK